MTEVRTSAPGPGFNKPAYRYIRDTDNLPTYDNLPDSGDVLCRVKLFNPTGIGRWWIASYDPDSGIAFGVAELFEREIGSFDMNELVALRGMMGLPIERDIHYTPTSINDLIEKGYGRP